MARVVRCIAYDREVYGSGVTCGTAGCIMRFWHIISEHPLASDCTEDCKQAGGG